MRTYTQCEDAGKNVGFQLVESRDLAVASDPCGPWCVPHLPAHIACRWAAAQLIHVKASFPVSSLQDARDTFIYHRSQTIFMRRYNRLKYGMSGRNMQTINHIIVSIVSFLHIAPKGVKEVPEIHLAVLISRLDLWRGMPGHGQTVTLAAKAGDKVLLQTGLCLVLMEVQLALFDGLPGA